jgi:D-hydroxyproline dehydrogenase subunit alpha
MSSVSRRKFDVLVVGGGPAGMAAATRAAECGLRVAIIDDNPALGGQIWRQGLQSTTDSEHSAWMTRLRSARPELIGGTVFDQRYARTLAVEQPDGICEMAYDKLILATGARERFLPFPGWTLPNVIGPGGLQALVKSGLNIRGKRILVAGTGPLLVGVAAYLLKHNANVIRICEQASWANLARFTLGLLEQPRKLTQGFRLKRELARIPFSPNSWPVAASGHSAVESVTISRNGRLEEIPCDYLACGFHLVPNVELPHLLGCRIQNGCVRVDDFQRTTVADILCAGEPIGIAGVECALVEGQIAGLTAANRLSDAQFLFGERRKLRRFARRLDEAFKLRSELRSLASADTLVCRCEDVRYSQLRRYTSWRTAKLQTRCGMGPCQGRICGPATQFLLKWDPDSVRPPIFPVRVESLAFPASSVLPEQPTSTGGL